MAPAWEEDEEGDGAGVGGLLLAARGRREGGVVGRGVVSAAAVTLRTASPGGVLRMRIRVRGGPLALRIVTTTVVPVVAGSGGLAWPFLGAEPTGLVLALVIAAVSVVQVSV